MPLKNINFSASQKANTATDSAELLGLCMTCNFAPTCVHRQRQTDPIWFCEQFEDYQVVPKRILLTSPPRPPLGEEKVSVSVKGLCANCDNRDACKLHQPEEGIWHCEEYL